MKIYGFVQDSIVDGPGFRFACFVQGCPHHCPGCLDGRLPAPDLADGNQAALVVYVEHRLHLQHGAEQGCGTRIATTRTAEGK